MLIEDPDNYVRVQQYFMNAAVEGIGDVRALQLISKFGTLENLLKCVDQVEGERIRETLITHADQAILSKNVVLLSTFIFAC
ncbi:hypothetical protein Pint_02593 [Pistacia integerrima]|uniref:Uncharacterized protein n=1 Tax=Pistacia integerrima TaxID=434235 RepID=A0ACC0ZMX0_9ROSI|nr:hypothetical protein Pint_02593 [Pistacia integerrima]